MMNLASKILELLYGKTLVTAESITGGGIGSVLTGVPGSSAVYKGGIISYCDEVKASALGVTPEILLKKGAVSAEVARQMAIGAREKLKANVAVSVTGLAGPDGDEYGNPVGTVCIGYSSNERSFTKQFRFDGDREEVRNHAIHAALTIVLEMIGE